MLKLKALIAKIVNWYGFRFDWSEQATNNTTDTWVPVFTASGKIQHRVIPRDIITTRRVQATLNRTYGSHVSITAPTINGYTFVAWGTVATIGWVGSCYVETTNVVTTNIWNATTGQSGNGTVYATALYKANF